MNAWTDELRKEFRYYTPQEINTIFRNACKDGDFAMVQYLLTDARCSGHIDIDAYDNYAFDDACEHGHVNIVDYLLTSPDIQGHVNLFFHNLNGVQRAIQHGHLPMVQYFLPLLKEESDRCRHLFFQRACEHQQSDIICFLLSYSGEERIDFQNSEYTLEWAVNNNMKNVVRAMMDNLKNDNPLEYINFIIDMKEHHKKLYRKIEKFLDEPCLVEESTLYL